LALLRLRALPFIDALRGLAGGILRVRADLRRRRRLGAVRRGGPLGALAPLRRGPPRLDPHGRGSPPPRWPRDARALPRVRRTRCPSLALRDAGARGAGDAAGRLLGGRPRCAGGAGRPGVARPRPFRDLPRCRLPAGASGRIGDRPRGPGDLAHDGGGDAGIADRRGRSPAPRQLPPNGPRGIRSHPRQPRRPFFGPGFLPGGAAGAPGFSGSDRGGSDGGALAGVDLVLRPLVSSDAHARPAPGAARVGRLRVRLQVLAGGSTFRQATKRGPIRLGFSGTRLVLIERSGWRRRFWSATNFHPQG